MKIRRLQIRSYRGITELDAAIPPAGALFTGGNARGKSTCLKAIMACLTSQDISPDAIRLGEDRSEILIDIDDHTVKRVITRNSPSKVTVERDGMKASKAVTYLQELLGTSTLDPLAFYLADAKKRRAQILGALPIAVTREQLEKHAPDLPLDFDCSGHGLEVIARAHKFYYDERTAANKEAAEAKTTAERLTKESQALAAAVTPGPVAAHDEARAALADAEKAVLTLANRKTEAERAAERTASQRARIEELRVEASKPVPTVEDVTPLNAKVEESKALVADLEERLAAARRALAAAEFEFDKARTANARAEQAATRAKELAAQADALEAALAAATIATPTDAEVAAASAQVQTARENVGRAEAQARALASVEAATASTTTFRALEKEAAELDAVVKRLANEVPTQLLKDTQGIPGLSLDGDEILLDGKRLDALSGAEQLKFAVDLAKRTNAKSKILVCDGLERLDPEQMEAFVAMSTEGDWQLLGTRVSKGDLVIEAVENDDQARAAE